MANIIAKVAVYGDIHLNSKSYGAHRDYPSESLQYFQAITEVVKKVGATHLIGLGDFSFGRFHSLEYRIAVEKELEKQYLLTEGNRYELKGNHDVAGYGMTEREYYVSKGLLKESTNLQLGVLNISMIDYGEHMKQKPLIIDDSNHVNFILAHDFFKFNKTAVANYGKAIELDNFSRWYGADCILCGHVHKILNFSGFITNGDMAHQCEVHYLGCMTRPSYREGHMDEVGQVMIISVYDDGNIDYNMEIIPLWELEDSFNLDKKQIEADKKAIKESRVDITDVVTQLDSHDRTVGNPEDIINALDNVDVRYKNKAIELLRQSAG